VYHFLAVEQKNLWLPRNRSEKLSDTLVAGHYEQPLEQVNPKEGSRGVTSRWKEGWISLGDNTEGK
jgi:hypothetical protein